MRWWQMRKRDADLERELKADLELEEEEQRERGLPRDEARYAALRAFGNPTAALTIPIPGELNRFVFSLDGSIGPDWTWKAWTAVKPCTSWATARAFAKYC